MDHCRGLANNIWGVIAASASPLGIVAVAFAPAGGANAWLKVAALGAGICYLNSVLATVFLDRPNYTQNSVMQPIAHTIRPYVPLISYLTVTGVVALAVDLQRWEPAMVPIAFLCATSTLSLGSTIRNHDRVIAAAAFVGRQAVEAGRKELGGVVHDDLGPAKAAAERIGRQDGVAYRDVVDLQTLSAFLTHFSTRVSLFATQRMPVSYLAKKIAARYGISPRDVTCVVQWDEPALRWDEHVLRKEDHRIALRMTTALVHNVGQALQKEENHVFAKAIAVKGFTTGCGSNRRYHIAVCDHLPLIADEDWCTEGGTLCALRQWLRDWFNGDLRQQQLDDGTKRIIASWGDWPPRRTVGHPRSSATCKCEMPKSVAS